MTDCYLAFIAGLMLGPVALIGVFIVGAIFAGATLRRDG